MNTYEENFEENQNEIVKIIREQLKEAVYKVEEGGSIIDFAVICNCAIRLLDEIFGEDKYTFPIDIHAIYEKMGIPLCEMDLNSYMEGCTPRRVNRIIGKISIRKDFMTENMKKSIYIEENASPVLQRYAMAHELCHYIMMMGETDYYTDEYCNMPMLPKSNTELVADAFAIYLLIPLGPFLEEFLSYVKKEKNSGRPPFRTAEWIEHLSAVSDVSKDYVACGYEQIRIVTAWLFEMKEIMKKNEQEKENNQEKYKAKTLMKKIDKYLSDEVIEHLFL